MSNPTTRMFTWLSMLVMFVCFPVALGISLFSGCEVRHRTEKQACAAGSVEQCLAVANLYDDAAQTDDILAVLLDYPSEAARFYEQACKLGSGPGCYAFGKLSPSGQVRAFTQGCEAHVPQACAALGMLYVSGDGVTRDDARAAQLFTAACEGKSGDGCDGLAWLHVNGRGGLTIDPEAAVRLFDAACNHGNRDGCKQSSSYSAHGRFDP